MFHARAQRGAILVTSILLLLVLTLIGLTAMSTSRMQERMSGNARDMNLAFQGAEAALRNGEALLGAQNFRPAPCTAAPCDFWAQGALPNVEAQAQAWWDANSREFGTANVADVAALAADPQYVVEALGFVPDSLTVGHGPPEGRDFYQVSGRSTGGSGNANVTLQTTFTRRY